MKLFYLLLLFYCLPFLSVFSQQKENLGSNINSQLDELHPVLTPDGNTLYFVRSSNKRNSWGEEAWYSTLDSNGNWTYAQKFSVFDSEDIRNVKVQSFSPDGNIMYVSLDYYDNNLKDKFRYSSKSGFYTSSKTDSGWNIPIRLEVDNIDKYIKHRNGLFLTNDGNYLFQSFSLTSHPEDPHNRIAISFKKGENSWFAPKDIPIFWVASFYGCYSPFLAADGVTLYFSGGNEDGDIFVSKRLDNSWFKWSQPELVNLNVLSKNFDADLIITPDGSYAYFVTNIPNETGGTDIFKIKFSNKKEVLTGNNMNTNYSGLYRGIQYFSGESDNKFLKEIYPIILDNDTAHYLYYEDVLIRDFKFENNLLSFYEDSYNDKKQISLYIGSASIDYSSNEFFYKTITNVETSANGNIQKITDISSNDLEELNEAIIKQKEFDNFWINFVNSLRYEDIEKLCDLVNFPFKDEYGQVYSKFSDEILLDAVDRIQFKKIYKQIFTDQIKHHFSFFTPVKWFGSGNESGVYSITPDPNSREFVFKKFNGKWKLSHFPYLP